MRLYIIGAGGHGKVVADIASACNYDDIAFLDSSWPERKKHGVWKIVNDTLPNVDSLKFCAIGNNARRSEILMSTGLQNTPNLVHPGAIVAGSVGMGSGTLIVAGAVVNADSVIGNGVILNTSCSVDHDCFVDDFAHVSPGARLGGGVSVGKRSWIGIGSAICEGIKIGSDVLVAAGATVISDVPDGSRVAGTPAKVF